MAPPASDLNVKKEMVYPLDDALDRLFDDVLRELADTDVFGRLTSPSIFVVYAHDNDGKGNASARCVRSLIKWLSDIRSRTLSDKAPLMVTREGGDASVRNILSNQFCLLPPCDSRTDDARRDIITSVDKILLCGSKVLQEYSEHPLTTQYIDTIVSFYNEAGLQRMQPGAVQRGIRDIVEDNCSAEGFHHVLTELAFLKLRRLARIGDENDGIIPIALSGDGLTYLQFLDNCDLFLKVEPSEDLGRQYKLFLGLLKQLYPDSGAHDIIIAYQNCFNNARQRLRDCDRITEAIFNSIKVDEVLKAQDNVMQIRKTAIRQLDWTLEHKSRVKSGPKRRVFGGYVPRLVSTFVGRDSEIDTIEARLQKGVVLALTGIAAIGKSQVATKYYHRCKTDHPKRHIFWMQFDTIEASEKSFSDIAQEVGLPGWDEPGVDAKLLVGDWLRTEASGEWLLILDNADREAVYTNAKGCIPLDGTRGYIITTSQTTAMPAILGAVDAMPISALPPVDARELFGRVKSAGYEISDENLARLLKLLQHHPLTIRQAAAYLGNMKVTVEKYIQDMESMDANFAALLGRDFSDKDLGRFNSICRALGMTFTRLWEQSDWSFKLLSQMAYLYRDEIPLALLWDPEGGDKDNKYNWEEALDVLKQYSLVTDGPKEDTYSIPRVIQVAARSWLDRDKMAQQRVVGLGRATTLCAQQFPIGNFSQWGKCESLYPHAQIIVEHQEKLAPHGPGSIPTSKETRSYARLLFRMASYEWRMGRFDMAIRHSEAAFKIWPEDYLDEEDGSERVRCRTLTAQVQHEHGNYRKAKQLYQQAIKDREKAIKERQKSLGITGAPPDPLTLEINHGLAMTLRKSQDFRGAEGLLRAIITQRQYLLSLSAKGAQSDDTDILTARGDLAGILLDQKRYTEGKQELESILAAKTALLGDHDPSTLTTQVHLAEAFGWLNQWAEAGALLRVALHRYNEGIDRQHAPLKHPDTVICMNQLAGVLMQQGRPAEADTLFTQAIEQYEAGVGGVGKEKNEQLITVLMNHVVVLEQLSDTEALRARLGQLMAWGAHFEREAALDSARALYEWALDTYRTNLGADDEGTRRCQERMRGLANRYWQNGCTIKSLWLKYLSW